MYSKCPAVPRRLGSVAVAFKDVQRLVVGLGILQPQAVDLVLQTGRIPMGGRHDDGGQPGLFEGRRGF